MSRPEGRRGRRGMERVIGKEVFPALGEAFPGFASTDKEGEEGAAEHAEHTSVNRG